MESVSQPRLKEEPVPASWSCNLWTNVHVTCRPVLQLLTVTLCHFTPVLSRAEGLASRREVLHDCQAGDRVMSLTWEDCLLVSVSDS